MAVINAVLVFHQFNKYNYQNRILRNFFQCYFKVNFLFRFIVLKIEESLAKFHHFFGGGYQEVSS